MASTSTTTEIYTARQGGQRDYTVISAPDQKQLSVHKHNTAHRIISERWGQTCSRF